MREACSNCPFKEDHNPADITLADFWGIPEYLRKNFENSRNGISLVVARTEKGRHFWDKVKSASICYKAKEADALPGNPALRYPLDLPVGWDEFKADFPVMPFTDFLKKWSFPQTVSAFTPVSVREKCAAAVLRFLNAIRSSGLFRPQVLILTHPLRYNYGGILQAFALQKALRKCGFRAVTWDTPYPGINPNPRLPAAKKFRLMLGNAFLKYVLRRPDVWVRPWNGNRDSDYYYDNRADDADRERRSVLEMKSRYTLPFIWKHIRLTSTWFKEYLYIPLGGSRRGAGRTLLNLAIVFLVTGIWHGAAWTFVFWGIYHGVFILFERLFFKEKVLDRLPRIVSQLYCLGAVFIGWIFFRADDLAAGCRIVRALVVPRDSPFRIEAFFSPALGVLLLTAFCLCGPVQALFPKLRAALFDETKTRLWEPFALTAILALCVIQLASSSYNPFIYFRF